MGKKGSWFSAIKRVFTHNSSKEKPSDVSDNRINKEKKKGKGILRHGERKSIIPLFREPSSIEQILGEADQLFIRPSSSSSYDSRTLPPIIALPTDAPPPTVSSNRLTLPNNAAFQSTFTAGSSSITDFPKVTQSRKESRYVQRPEQTLRNRHLSAVKIQAAYRGYLARRNFRAFRGLVRLQGMVRSQNVKRQAINAMKQMQLLVRVQTQIQSRRIQMSENQTLFKQEDMNEKEVESTMSKWTTNQLPEADSNGDWDDSLLTKEEVEARLRKKVEAVMKKERVMAYAYSHKLWKTTTNPIPAQCPLQNHSNGSPLWWNYLDPPTNTPQTQSATKKVALTPTRPILDKNPSPQVNAVSHNNLKNPTPNNQHHVIRTKHVKTTTTPIRTPSPSNISKQRRYNYSPMIYNDFPLRDDDSLTSCPPFSIPNYMTPTASAKAKTRANSNPKERVLLGTTPVNDSKRRFSFSLTTPNIGLFKWDIKGSSSKNETVAQKVGLEKHQFSRSIGDLSVDSAVSMPAIVGRKPFNRFV